MNPELPNPDETWPPSYEPVTADHPDFWHGIAPLESEQNDTPEAKQARKEARIAEIREEVAEIRRVHAEGERQILENSRAVAPVNIAINEIKADRKENRDDSIKLVEYDGLMKKKARLDDFGTELYETHKVNTEQANERLAMLHQEYWSLVREN